MLRYATIYFFISIVGLSSVHGQTTMSAEAQVVPNIQFGSEEQGVQFGTFPFNCEPYVKAADNTFEGCPNDASGTYSRGYINLIFEPEQHFQLTITAPDSLYREGGTSLERVKFELTQEGASTSLNGLVTADIPTSTNEPTPITNGDGSDFLYDSGTNTFTTPGEESEKKLQMPTGVNELYVVVGGNITNREQYKATGTYKGTITLSATVLN
jgi:hypothetical protein